MWLRHDYLRLKRVDILSGATSLNAATDSGAAARTARSIMLSVANA